MLTVRYQQLGVRAGDRLLDLGTGGGRHAFEAMRVGAQVVALDTDRAEVRGAAALMAGLAEEDEATRASGGRGAACTGDALALPFPDGCFDRVIAAEVLEHIPDDRRAMAELARVLRLGGTMAVTVPRWGPELINWVLSDEYHLVPGGHVRLYRRRVLLERLTSAGLTPYGSHHAHALHSPYWWLRCAVGLADEQHRVVRAYHRLLVWDITARPWLTRRAEALLDPVMGKSLVVYAEKPA